MARFIKYWFATAALVVVGYLFIELWVRFISGVSVFENMLNSSVQDKIVFSVAILATITFYAQMFVSLKK